jgi:predicted unusual protein kinase regulating ubiquinone biosynthesis (AarF/ABC1/UbiB family)
MVAKQVEEGLGKSMAELFESFDPKPLACASIAQVPKPSTQWKYLMLATH